jgi:predicted tellurium resistance membrane protein TerC
LIEYLSDPLFWTRLLQIIGVDIILAGDNAVVIALACRNLDPRHRNKAIVAGSLGAVGLRVLFVFFVVWLMAVPYLKARRSTRRAMAAAAMRACGARSARSSSPTQ